MLYYYCSDSFIYTPRADRCVYTLVNMNQCEIFFRPSGSTKIHNNIHLGRNVNFISPVKRRVTLIFYLYLNGPFYVHPSLIEIDATTPTTTYINQPKCTERNNGTIRRAVTNVLFTFLERFIYFLLLYNIIVIVLKRLKVKKKRNYCKLCPLHTYSYSIQSRHNTIDTYIFFAR